MPKKAELERLVAAAVEAAIAEIGHNGGPPLDDLLPDRLVAERYDCTVRTLERWDEDPELGFPPPIYVRRRKFRELSKLEAWERANTRKVADSYNPSRAVAQTLSRVERGRFSKTRSGATTEPREATVK
jgi:hypothetical protein